MENVSSGTIWQPAVHEYGSRHKRQLVYIEQRVVHSNGGVFIVFVHGGAWRDDRQDYRDFTATVEAIKNQEEFAPLREKVQAMASIDYGLSPYPGRPSDDPSRQLQHPQHIDDVHAGLALCNRLAEQAGCSHMVLMGHSCGAMLMLQALRRQPQLVVPSVVMGMAGIYDLPKLAYSGRAQNKDDKEDAAEQKQQQRAAEVQTLVTGAFGKDEAVWREVSPRWWPREDLKAMLSHSVVALVHSRDDEQCNIEQTADMWRHLQSVGLPSSQLRMFEFNGYKHDAMWAEGTVLARVIVSAGSHLLAEGNVGSEGEYIGQR